MKAIGRYCDEMQMFIEEPREPSPEHLGFLRYLRERGQLDNPRKVDTERTPVGVQE